MVPIRYFLIVPALAVSTICAGCNLCKTETIETSVSPDGKWIAETISADCGAVTRALVRVNVRPSSVGKASAENNVFVVDNFGTVQATWKDSTTIVVRCLDCVARNIETKHETHGPIHVVYDLH
jgi:hypothetical protein